jgi:hypothetical protein
VAGAENPRSRSVQAIPASGRRRQTSNAHDGYLPCMRRLALAACLLALPCAAACGGNDEEGARKAAEGYVSTLGKRDGAGTCARMTKGLQRQFTAAVVRTDARFRGRSCPQVMQAALDSIPPAQLRQFTGAKIDNLTVKDDRGTFRYTLGGIRVDGKVAKEDGDWKVSCCVPGTGG